MRQIAFTRFIVTLLTIFVLLLVVSRSGMLAQAISENDVYAVAWSPDGSKIAGVGGNGQFTIWNPSGQVLLQVTGLTGLSVAVTWSPDSSKIATGSNDGIVRIWNASNGTLIEALTGHTDVIQSVVWSPDGTKIASASFQDRPNLRVWDAITYQQLNAISTGALFKVSWKPDSSELAVSRANGYSTIYASNLVSLRSISFSQSIAAIDWSPDSNRIASSTSDGVISIWDASSLNQITHFQGSNYVINALEWNPNNLYLVAAGQDGVVRVWDTSAQRVIRSYSTFNGNLSTVISWSPDGNRLAFGDGTDLRIETVFREGADLRQRWGRHPTACR